MRLGSRSPEPVNAQAEMPNETGVTPPQGRSFRFTAQQEHQATILAAFQTSAETLEDCKRAVAHAEETAERLTTQAQAALGRAQKVAAETRRQMRAVAEGKI